MLKMYFSLKKVWLGPWKHMKRHIFLVLWKRMLRCCVFKWANECLPAQTEKSKERVKGKKRYKKKEKKGSTSA